MSELIISTLKQSLMITVFVLIMMVVIEYINIQSKNRWAENLQKSPLLQIFVAALLGIIPGCMGAFTVVSLYTHRMIGFAALVTAMIATSGDESFVMFALFPVKALIIHVGLFVMAITTGWIVHRFSRQKNISRPYGFVVHEHEYCDCFSKSLIIPQLKAMSFERAVLLLFSLIFTVLLISGVIGQPAWDWKKITFLAGVLFLLFVFVTVPEHFLKEHLYKHILKKHLLRIFLWTWGTFLLLHVIQSNLILNDVMQNNNYVILLIAVLIGLIPESGPHLVFVTLFSKNLLPFSIMFANSVVQDGHGMLPLLAESRKDFIKVKLLNMFVGLLTGMILLQFGI
ncbi:MAG: arsenic efflux protein [Bacteroidales bacterium]|nr:arsenic efflux protein [Bacteroidales bacterium]